MSHSSFRYAVLLASCHVILVISGRVPEVVFLKGVPRLHNASYTDYYFSCNVNGEFLQWQYEEEPLSGFRMGEAGRVIVDVRTTFQYTATLLSSEPDGQQENLDSVLVVSFQGNHPNNFSITCSSHLSSHTITAEIVSNVEFTDDQEQVILDHVISQRIVKRMSNTHIFICGAKSLLQFISVNDPQIGFGEFDYIGKDRTVLTADSNTVSIQGVLIARDPFQTTTLLFVVDDADVHVACFYGQHQANLNASHLSIIYTSPLSPEINSTSPLTAATSSATVSNRTTTEVIVTESHTSDIIGIVNRNTSATVATIVVLLMIVISALGALVLFFLVRIPKRRKYTVKSINSEEVPQYMAAAENSCCQETEKGRTVAQNDSDERGNTAENIVEILYSINSEEAPAAENSCCQETEKGRTVAQNDSHERVIKAYIIAEMKHRHCQYNDEETKSFIQPFNIILEHRDLSTDCLTFEDQNGLEEINEMKIDEHRATADWKVKFQLLLTQQKWKDADEEEMKHFEDENESECIDRESIKDFSNLQETKNIIEEEVKGFKNQENDKNNDIEEKHDFEEQKKQDQKQLRYNKERTINYEELMKTTKTFERIIFYFKSPAENARLLTKPPDTTIYTENIYFEEQEHPENEELKKWQMSGNTYTNKTRFHALIGRSTSILTGNMLYQSQNTNKLLPNMRRSIFKGGPNVIADRNSSTPIEKRRRTSVKHPHHLPLRNLPIQGVLITKVLYNDTTTNMEHLRRRKGNGPTAGRQEAPCVGSSPSSAIHYLLSFFRHTHFRLIFFL